MNLRSEMVRKLLSDQYSHLVQELEKKAANLHEKEMDEWKLSLEDIFEAKDVTQYVGFFSLSTSIFSLYYHFQGP